MIGRAVLPRCIIATTTVSVTVTRGKEGGIDPESWPANWLIPFDLTSLTANKRCRFEGRNRDCPFERCPGRPPHHHPIAVMLASVLFIERLVAFVCRFAADLRAISVLICVTIASMLRRTCMSRAHAAQVRQHGTSDLVDQVIDIRPAQQCLRSRPPVRPAWAARHRSASAPSGRPLLLVDLDALP